MEYKGSSWHETCFTCHRCQQPIGTKSFIPKDGQNFCVPCYEKQHALQCIQCKKVPSPRPAPTLAHLLVALPQGAWLVRHKGWGVTPGLPSLHPLTLRSPEMDILSPFCF